MNEVVIKIHVILACGISILCSFSGIFAVIYVEVFGLHGGIARKSGKLVLGIHLHRKQKRSHIHFRCTEGSNASAEGAKLYFGLGGEDRRHAPMGKSVF